jgi:hypothetical protein
MYTAIIIEPRKHQALSYVLNNVLSNLSDEWNVIVFHGTENLNFLQTLLSTDLSQVKDRITLQNLGVSNLNIDDYNKLLTTKSFYDHIPTEMFLVFQTDSIIIPKYSFLIDAFLKYDYVGAPWTIDGPLHGNIGNGGFSLRRKTKMLEIIEKVPYRFGDAEDVYFSISPVSLYKPSWEQAKLFSVEHVFSEITFGCHKPWDGRHYQIFQSIHPEVAKLRTLQQTIKD